MHFDLILHSGTCNQEAAKLVNNFGEFKIFEKFEYVIIRNFV
jgi:hypothetical protein